MATQNFSKKPIKERIHINVARIKKNGKNFEVVIDPDKVIAYKNHTLDDVREVVMAEHIFENAKKGLFSAKNDLAVAFGVLSEDEIATYIITHGELQLSEQYRKTLAALKRNRIIEIIHRNAINPDNNLPHPITRITNAFEEAKIRIDDKKSADDQVQAILKQLKPILPIKFETKKLQIHISAKYAQKNYALIKSYGKILKDEWLEDGCYFVTIEVPAGIYTDIMDELNKRTHGGVEITIVQ